MSALALATLLAAAAPEPWIVLPIHCTEPPPADPTLLRTTKTIAEAIHQTLGEEVRVASRDLRDERCPREDGDCPPDVARAIGVERVIVLVLSAKYDALTVRIFHDGGVEREGRLPCRWESGGVECDTAELGKILAPVERPKLDPQQVKSAFEAKLTTCKKPDPATEAYVSFRAKPDGRVIDVRIEPIELQEADGYACIARQVESLRVAPFAGTKPELFRFPLGNVPPPAKKKTPAPKKSTSRPRNRSRRRAADLRRAAALDLLARRP